MKITRNRGQKQRKLLLSSIFYPKYKVTKITTAVIADTLTKQAKDDGIINPCRKAR